MQGACKELCADGAVSTADSGAPLPATRPAAVAARLHVCVKRPAVLLPRPLAPQIKSVVFLNCGAVDSLETEVLNWHPTVRGYVIDSHR